MSSASADELRPLATGSQPRWHPPTKWSHRVTMADVEYAYRLFLRREVEEIGYRHYEGEVKRGMTLDRLAAAFMEADEFKRLCRVDVQTVDLGGYSVCLDAKDTDFAPGILFNHDYEPHVRAAIRGLFQPGQTFVDIGANIGCISLLAASIAGPEGRVIAFEPNPNNLQRLYGGIVLNGFTNVKVMPYAVSDRPATFSLSGGTSNTTVTEARGVDTATVYAQAVVPDDELAHLPAIDFIKIDIEGHEPHALAGCTRLIEKHNPTLLTEFAPRCLGEIEHLDPRDYLRQVFALYPRVRAITHYGDDAEFDGPDAVMDYWHRRNAELVAEGKLPDGMLHFDLIATRPKPAVRVDPPASPLRRLARAVRRHVSRPST